MGDNDILYQFYKCFFFNDTATTEIYTLSLHDALPIFSGAVDPVAAVKLDKRYYNANFMSQILEHRAREVFEDRKSTRLNSSHANISYAVFCLKKKTEIRKHHETIKDRTSSSLTLTHSL